MMATRLRGAGVGCAMMLALLGGLTTYAGAAFERDVRLTTADAVCDAGPRPELIDLLTGPEPEARWRIRATSMELYGLNDESFYAGLSARSERPFDLIRRVYDRDLYPAGWTIYFQLRCK